MDNSFSPAEEFSNIDTPNKSHRAAQWEYGHGERKANQTEVWNGKCQAAREKIRLAR